MPSSTSSFKPSDAPPAYQRELPAFAVGRAWLVAAVLFFIGITLWEAKWRAFGAEPGAANSDGLWALQRRRIDHGEGDKTVIIGSSRALFDVQLPVWERVLGERPIQLALEGTGPVPFLEDLADDPKFTGRLLVGVSPVLFFSGFDRRLGALSYFRRETPAQRTGQWLSMHLLEPFIAFYQGEFAFMTVLKRQPWPGRAGVVDLPDVRKLSTSDPDRNTRMWKKVEVDPEYQQVARKIWNDILTLRPRPAPDAAKKVRDAEIERAVAAVEKLRARGVPVVFVRPPSSGKWYEAEERGFPRAENWDALLARTGAPGIYFEDYPELLGFTLPEWSHLAASDAGRFTEGLCGILERDFGWTPTSPNP
ncbi:MAG: hypothetical protein ABI883_03690 [Chthoniobacterales bacterium]